MTTPRWQTVLFDLDGTLCNTIPLILASYQHAFREVLGTELDTATGLGWIGRTLRDTFAEFPKAAELEDAYRAFNHEHLVELQQGYEGIRELVVDLLDAGVSCGIVTSKRRYTAGMSLEAGQLDGLLPVLCAMEDTEVHKPDPTPLLLGLERLDAVGAGPERAVYVGDATVDLQAAAAAGIAGIGVTWGAGVPDRLAEQPHAAICDTVDELRAALLK